MSVENVLERNESAARGCVRRLVRMRDAATISNDLAEGFPVTKAELLKLVRAEQRDNQRQQNRINALRDAMVWIGLTLVSAPTHNPNHAKCLLKISDALKHPNEKS